LNSGRVLCTAFVFLLGAFLTLETTAQEVPVDITSDLPPGANRIIIEQDVDVPEDIDPTPKGLYMDAREALEEAGFQIATTAPESHVLTTEPKQVSDSLAVKVKLNVIESGTGSTLVASASWAPSAMAMTEEWHEAAWTEGRSREAFEEAVGALREIYYVSLYAGVELGVAERDTR
jgi:hypothetical protein